MSINQHYQWWSHHMTDSSSNTSSSPNHPSTFCQLSPTNNPLHRTADMFSNRNGAVSSFDLNNDDGEEPTMRLFEKPLTPSDVGKLNRLVIPKQHAEKHFPLNGGAPEPGENGLLLGFEDENGKPWRFRYSYWNSSQSYVLTKGWSRFVKEKRLDAGDIVVFSRHRVNTRRLFIGWRRRDSDSNGAVSQPPPAMANGGGWGRVLYPGQYAYPGQHLQAGPISSVIPYQSSAESILAGTVVQQEQQQNGNSRRLRLFGVNMECYDESESSTPLGLGSPMSSQAQAHHPYHHQYYYNNHM
ncbi:hypothetical protein CASFOL_027253 [Castilleja foliolosa]|uniref:TF-B3 domain-containing protein n=1 Tax=Castilleja foliolosa TaxID=1961234 RepID=A0ABD3CFC9_9LAMI